MPLGVNIVSALTLQIPGSEGKAPPGSIFYMPNNIKVYANLLSGKIAATPAEAAGLMISLKL